MGIETKKMDCANHGLVLAQRKVLPGWLYWSFAIFSFGYADWTLPFRCPKCGRLTEPRGRTRDSMGGLVEQKLDE